MMYDLNTKNLSFLRMSKALRNHGVKNNKFMLWLYDDSLSGVDPYSPDLTFDEKARIYAEICKNFWYYLREVCMIPSQGSAECVHFKLNLGNLAMSYCNINNINSITMLPRQQGKTIAEVSFSNWVHMFATYHTTETYLHKAQDGATDNLKQFKAIKEALPAWLQELVCSKNDKDNLEEKYFYTRKNQIRALASASTDEAADKMGRGSSTPLVYMDEFAFMARNKIIYNALIPAWGTAAANAKKNGAPYGIRLTTTPNTLSLPQARYCYELIQEACRFSYNIYDVPANELSAYVSANSDNDFVYIEYSYTELGLDQVWYNTLLRKMNNDRLNAKRELDLIWPESDEDSVFDESELEMVKKYVRPILFTLTVNGYAINFYEKPSFDMNYILSCDVSGGLSQDRSVINIIHPGDFHVVGLFASARIDTDSFRNLISTIMTQYLIHSILIIENNSYGLAILDVLMKNTAIEPRMYREQVERKGEKTLVDGHTVEKTSMRLVYGVSTTKDSRKVMYDILGTIVRDYPEIIISEMFYNEIKTLQVKKNSKIEAMEGFHDDVIMSYLIFRYALACGKCLRNMFGILPVASAHNVRASAYDGQVVNDFGAIIDLANQASYQDYGQGNLDPFTKSAIDMSRRQRQMDIMYGIPDAIKGKTQSDDGTPIDGSQQGQNDQSDSLFYKICDMNDPDDGTQNDQTGFPF